MIAVLRTAGRALLAGSVLIPALLLVVPVPAAADPEATPITSPTSSPISSPTSSAAASESPGDSPAPAAVPAGTVTATATVDCANEVIVVEARNTTAQPVRVGAFLSPAATPATTLEVAAGGSATGRVEPGAGPFELAVRRLDTGETLATAEGFFSCPARQDLAIQVRSGSSYEARDVCAVAFFLGARGPLHGTVAVREGGFVYTPAPGYTGPDRFDYQCLTSESIFGTVRVTVLPAVAPVPTEPPPAPGLPATGTSGLPVQVAAGLVLVGLGILVHRRARRRPAGLS